MSPLLKRLLAALASLAALLALLLLPPLMTEQAIADSLKPDAARTAAPEEGPLAWPALGPEGDAIATPQPTREAVGDVPAVTLALSPAPTSCPEEDPGAQPLPSSPSPMPAAGEERPDLLPLQWRSLLRQGDRDMAARHPGGAALADKELADDQPEGSQTTAAYYLDEATGTLIVDRLWPARLQEQKLLESLTANLGHPTIFVPDAQALDALAEIGLSAMSYEDTAGKGQDRRGGSAQFRGENLMIVRVMQEAARQRGRFISQRDYADLRDALVGAAQQLIFKDPDAALEKSMALIGQGEDAEDGGLSGQLTVIDAEPYSCEADWEIYAAGHHLTCLDNASGRVTIYTTDLLTERRIGSASQDSLPWLKRYQALVERGREAFAPDSPQAQARVLRAALPLIEQLSGMDGLTDVGKWEHTARYLYAPEWQKGYWDIVVQPADILAYALDDPLSFPTIINLEMEEDMSLRGWYQGPAGHATGSEEPVLTGGQLDTQQLARMEGMDKDWLAAIERTSGRLEQIEEQALSLLSLSWKPVTREGAGYLGFARYEGNHRSQQELVWHMNVKDGAGVAYSVGIGIDLQGGIYVKQISKMVWVPPDAQQIEG